MEKLKPKQRQKKLKRRLLLRKKPQAKSQAFLAICIKY
jgi:hypothetical protein